jgi:hypothetical protein
VIQIQTILWNEAKIEKVSSKRKSVKQKAQFFTLGFVLTSVLTLTHGILGVGIGSDTIPSREPFVIFPSVDTDNKIYSFAIMENGFALEDSATFCIFDSVFPVSKQLILNGGTLDLNHDLQLSSGAVFAHLGNIVGRSHSIELPSSLSDLGSPEDGLSLFEDTSLILNSTIQLRSEISFSGNCVIDGRGNTLNLGELGKILVSEDSHLLIKNVKLKGINGSKINCVTSTGTITLHNVEWTQDDDYVFTNGALQFDGDVTMRGSSIFAYQSGQKSTILSDSKMVLDTNFTFSYDPKLNTLKDLIQFIDSSSVLMLDGATLHTTVTGLELQKGTMVVKGDATISSEVLIYTIPDQEHEEIVDEGITFGSRNSADDFACIILGDAKLTLAQGSLNYKNVVASMFEMGNERSIVNLLPRTTLNVFENLALNKGKMVVGDRVIIARALGKYISGSLVPLGRLFNIHIPGA